MDRGPKDGRRRISVRTNTGNLTKGLQRELQRILDVARLQVEAIEKLESFGGAFAKATLQIHPANNRRLPLNELKLLAKERSILAAFRDAMESAQTLLEDARLVFAFWSLTGEIKSQDADERINRGADKFHRLSLPDKLNHLDDRFSYRLPPELAHILLSLNQVRNCLVHRGGTVGAKDCDSDGELKVAWRQHIMWAGKSPTATLAEGRPLGPGDVLVGGEYLLVGLAPRTIGYVKGSSISLTEQDLSEICHTLHLVGKQISADMARRSRELGHPQVEPGGAANS